MGSFLKDSDAVLDYKVDWTSWLAAGEVISTSDWVVPSGITQDSVAADDTSATIWLSGGTIGEEYEVTNRITTNAGRTDDRTITIWCVKR